jgi:hypothetical protein
MLKYLSIDGGILSNKSIPPTCKLIISYIANLQKGGKAFYGTYAYMSETLGIRFDYFEKNMTKLLEADILVASKEGITLGLLLDTIAERTWKLGA